MTVQRQVSIWLIVLGAIIAFMWLFADIMLPFLAGIVLAYFLDPVADALERLKLPRLAATLVIVLTSVQLTKQIRSRRLQRTALTFMAKYHPQEPLFSLMLLDYYFPTRQYEDALASLLRLYDRLDVEDAAMEARLSAATLVMGNTQDAEAHAEKALGLDPGLELAWWSALRARAALADFPRAVEALTRLENEFGYELEPDALDKDPGLKELLASEAYSGWLASRQQ